MKIFILPTPNILQPTSQPFRYPTYNDDYGVEQDFEKWLLNNPDLLTENSHKADWHYLPIYWTRWHLNHDYGTNGRKELKLAVDSIIIDDSKTFTICQYDDGPLVNLGKTLTFLSSRKDDSGIDIPLLAKRLSTPLFKPSKKYLASFVGRLSTHPDRIKLEQSLASNKRFFIADGNMNINSYKKIIMASDVSLSPRGYGGNSFRFYESMALGITPMLIGEHDTRPFKGFINWDSVSFYAKDVDHCLSILSDYAKKEDMLISMGRAAKSLYNSSIQYQKWCKYVLDELEVHNEPQH